MAIAGSTLSTRSSQSTTQSSFAEQHGRLDAWFDEISAEEWKDLAYFARSTLEVREQYDMALERAFDRLGSPIEHRSISKHRLAWKDVEFWRGDVIREWTHPSDADEPSADEREPPLAGVRAIAAPSLGAELCGWCQRRISELSAQDQTSSARRIGKLRRDNFRIASQGPGCGRSLKNAHPWRGGNRAGARRGRQSRTRPEFGRRKQRRPICRFWLWRPNQPSFGGDATRRLCASPGVCE